ncbi:MAG TPA: response regulator [Kofleriaceae bacterium]|nr:response regulator [Kofleriaceae bacterium]
MIEPSEPLRASFAQALVARGLEVQAVASAEEAVIVCETFSPDIVISDYYLGDEPAMDLLRELRRRHPGLMILLTSDAFATEQTIGAITLHPKPSEPKALLALLRRRVTADSLWHVRRDRAIG